MAGGYRFPYGTCGRADCGIFHMTVTGYFESIFEVVRHEIDREDAKKYASDIIGLNQKEPNSKGDAEFSPVLILS